MSDADLLKSIWSQQKDEPFAMSDAELKLRADRLRTVIGWRNAREYIASVFVVLFFGYTAATDTNPVVRAGALLIVVGCLFVVWWLANRVKPRGHNDHEAAPWLQRYRDELIRQRDALESVWLWYLMPFVPGLALMLAARHVYPEFRLTEPGVWLAIAGPLGLVGAIFGGIVWLNHTAAKNLRREINELDRANGD